MKITLLIIAVLFSVAVEAQVQQVTIQASGLTCSMCSNAINKALKSLEFVDKVDANIKNSTFDIFFKSGSSADFDKLKMKVEDAGFFVANFTVNLHFENIAITNDAPVTVGTNVFYFINVKNQTLYGNKTIRLLDKGFISAKEFKKNLNLTKMTTNKTGEENGKRIFHVTI